MIRFRLSVLGCALLLATPAAAQIVGRPFEFSAQLGWMHYDNRTDLVGSPVFAGTFGWRTQPWLVLEGNGLIASSQTDNPPDLDRSFLGAGVDLRANLRSAENAVVPYVLGGMGYLRTKTTGVFPDQLSRGSPSIGMGALFSLRGSQRAYLRVQGKDIFFRERGTREFTNHIAATVGIHYVWGGKVRDADLDGVRDWLDTCPATPLGAKVNAAGCPLDGDGDKVFDGIDACEGTPAGCTVDKKGCPSDPDGDGVCDGLDQCADTPKGATVDAKGCPADPDGDKVFDGIDTCPGTPAGCVVDAKGCPGDADSDGVCDGKDQCANTPEGLAVDPNGCPIEVSEKETELLDTGMIRLQNIEFDTGNATLKAESFPVIAEVARILQQFPTLRIQVGGHTDDRGSAALNDTLSASRARTVLEHMKTNFPQIPGSQYSSRGFGPSQPIAPNITPLGRSKNRRVEFKVLNTDALKIERERRRMLRKGETMQPAPAPAPVDTSRSVQPPPVLTPAPAPALPPAPAPADTSRRVQPPPPPVDTTRSFQTLPAPVDTSRVAPVLPDTTRLAQPAPPDTTRK